MKKNILIYTKISGIYGSGHFVRMKILMHYIENALNINAVFIIDGGENINDIKSTEKTITFEKIKKEDTLLIIVDKRETDCDIIKKLKDVSPVIIIDSNGDEKKFADIVIQMLPTIKESDCNIYPYNAAILNTSKLKYKKNEKVLIYLGDDIKILKKIIEVIKDINFNFDFVFVVKDNNLNSIIGSDRYGYYKNIIFINYGEDIFNFSYSHVITYFGLTAFEAVTNLIPTLLYPITNYHKELSKKCADIFFTIENIDTEALKESIEYFLSEKSNSEKFECVENAKKINTDNALTIFKKIILHIDNFNNITCPACKSKKHKLVYRNKESNLYRCEKCKTLFRKYFLDITENAEKDFYGENYFESDYKKQYGKTYKEDEENLSHLARERIKKIKTKQYGHILDLGSAMGFFIKECELVGFTAEGVEISKYAADYSKSIGLNVTNSSLLDFNYEENKYDVITMWYVLEHIEKLDIIIKKIKYSLKENGLLALSMPSSYGLTGRFNKEHYYNIVPSDHSTEFSIYSIDIFLKSYGFKKVSSENKSLYIERALKTFNIDYKIFKAKPFRKLYSVIGKIFNLGDTFECVYLLKKK